MFFKIKFYCKKIYLLNYFNLYNYAVFSIFTVLCRSLLNCGTCSPSRKETLYLSILSSSHPLATPTLLSAFMDLPVVDISYHWNYTVCGLSGLFYLMFKFHPCCKNFPLFFFQEIYSKEVIIFTSKHVFSIQMLANLKAKYLLLYRNNKILRYRR